MLLACASAFGQGWSFPHKTHLDKGLECTTCHSSAATSSAVEDRLLPGVETCELCHNGEVAPQIDLTTLQTRQQTERTYRFNHEQHLKLGNAAAQISAAIDGDKYFGKPGDIRRFLDTEHSCVACHRGLNESMAVAEKVHMPQMADCIVCHTEIDNPFTCPDCHNEGVNLLPADHTRTFVDSHSTGRIGLDKQSCLPCHGRNFGCMGCH